MTYHSIANGRFQRTIAVATSLWFLGASVSAVPISPFVAALGGVYDAPGNPVGPELQQSSATGPVLVSVGSVPAVGQFRAAFGSNGLDIQVVGGFNRAVYGGSIWTDGLTALGGTGLGSLTFNTHIQGAVTGQVEMGYALFVSSQPFDLQVIVASVAASVTFSGLQLPNAIRVMSTGIANRCGLPNPIGDCGSVPFQNFQGAFDETLNATVPMVYGQTFYVASLFESGVDVLGGNSTFFNSADFSVTMPPQTSLQSLSGTSYVSLVPEPPSALLLGAALLFLISMRRYTSDE